MSDPINTEHRFQTLREDLSFPHSPRHRLFEVASFFESLDHQPEVHEIYVLELVQAVATISEITLAGCRPEQVRSLLRALTRVRSVYALSTTVVGFNELVNALMIESATLFAYVGDLQSAIDILGGEDTPTQPTNSEIGVHRSPLSRVQDAIRRASDDNPTLAAHLHRIQGGWIPSHQDGVDVCSIPVVERTYTADSRACFHGALRQMELSVSGEYRARADNIEIHATLFGVENQAELLTAPVAAARLLISQTHPHLTKTFITGRFLLQGKHAMHQGTSASLAIAALVYCGILRFAKERHLFQISHRTIITGDLDENGNVLPVENKSLQSKVEAAFFSWADSLVVPRSQLAEAEKIAGKLTESYPNRELTITGVNHFRELFFDLRVTIHTQIPIVKHLAHRTWKHRHVIVGAFVFALVTVVARLLYGPIDKDPVSYDFEGEYLQIKNHDDAVLERISVGRRTVDFFRDGPGEVSPVALADVTGDSRKEVFWLQYPTDSNHSHMVLMCKTINEEERLWPEIPLQKAITFPNNTDVISSSFVARQLVVGDLMGNGRTEVLINAQHEYFPGVIFMIDANTGKEIGHYLHIGHFNDLEVGDLDGDGIKEIVLCGMNNALRSACLVVLDPRSLGGHSPLTEDYRPLEYQPARERAYVRIVPSAVGMAYRNRSWGNIGKWLQIDGSQATIRLAVDDLTIPAEKPEMRITATLFPTFNFDLTIRTIATGSDYDTVYETLREEKKIPDLRRGEYMKEYAKTVMYWNGFAWTGGTTVDPRFQATDSE